MAIALVCASAGGMLTWLAGPSKGLLLIARREGYLPPFFQHQNENDIPVNILVVQGAVTTVIALLYALIPSVSSAYWILSVMTTQVYLIVYLLMFVAAVKLRKRQPNVERGYTAPALTFLCVVGFLASAAAILIGFVPPSQFENGSDGGLRRADPGRHGAARPAAAVAVPEVPQARAGSRPSGGVVMSATALSPRRRTSAGEPPHVYLVIGGRRRRPVRHRPDHLHAAQDDRGGAGRRPQQLTAGVRAAGLPVPADRTIIVRSLGRRRRRRLRQPRQRARQGDAARSDDQRRRSFVGRRPVIVDRASWSARR